MSPKDYKQLSHQSLFYKFASTARGTILYATLIQPLPITCSHKYSSVIVKQNKQIKILKTLSASQAHLERNAIYKPAHTIPKEASLMARQIQPITNYLCFRCQEDPSEEICGSCCKKSSSMLIGLTLCSPSHWTVPDKP